MKKLLIGLSIMTLLFVAVWYGFAGLGYIGMKILPKFLIMDFPYSNYTTNCFMNGILPFLGLCIIILLLMVCYQIGSAIIKYKTK